MDLWEGLHIELIRWSWSSLDHRYRLDTAPSSWSRKSQQGKTINHAHDVQDKGFQGRRSIIDIQAKLLIDLCDGHALNASNAADHDLRSVSTLIVLPRSNT